jgi:hypothetical protein
MDKEKNDNTFDQPEEIHSIHCASYTTEALQKRGHVAGKCDCKDQPSVREENQEEIWKEIFSNYPVADWLYSAEYVKDIASKFTITRKTQKP